MDGRVDGRRGIGETAMANLELKRSGKLLTKRKEFHFNLICTMPKGILAGKGLRNHIAQIPAFLLLRILRSSHHRESPMRSHPQREKAYRETSTTTDPMPADTQGRRNTLHVLFTFLVLRITTYLLSFLLDEFLSHH